MMLIGGGGCICRAHHDLLRDSRFPLYMYRIWCPSYHNKSSSDLGQSLKAFQVSKRKVGLSKAM